jgi:hypothetical protein
MISHTYAERQIGQTESEKIVSAVSFRELGDHLGPPSGPESAQKADVSIT